MLHPTPLQLLRATSDRELVERCVAGEEAAQRDLFERERRRVHGTLYKILGSNHQIEDVLQEVFIAVFRGLPRFRAEASLATWIDRCAVHAAFTHLRRGRNSRNHLELVPESLASEEPSAERRALAREAVRRLYATLDRLEPKPRTAFALHAIDGRPLPEVAELMAATLIVTKARVWRARKFVEKCAKADPVLADFLQRGGARGVEGAP